MGSIFKLTALAGVAAGAYAAVKKFAPNILPDKNEAEDMAKNAINSVKLTFPTDEKYSNGTALTPPMGWSSWNTFRNRIDEKLILETAEAMKASGLADAGYQYVNLDDCWQSSMRDENGRLQGDFANFPSGIPALVKSINELGLKLGIYSSNGSLTCEDLPASLGNEAIDADTFAEWNKTEQESYLLDITSTILLKKDSDVDGCKPSDAFLVDRIQDQAPAKRSGVDTLAESVAERCDVSIVADAIYARYASIDKDVRRKSEYDLQG